MRSSASELPAEFALIARHFRPLAGPGALELGDDAAVFMPPAGRELVVAADAMVAGVHFLPDDPPGLVGRKLLRTNLSDLAAMGAEPLGYLMTVSAPRDTPDAWFAGFAAGLAADQAEFHLFLLGGDTTSTPGPISLSLTILGSVAPGTALRRNGARAGRRHLGQRQHRRRRAGIAGGNRAGWRTPAATWPTATACRGPAWPSAACCMAWPERPWTCRMAWCRTLSHLCRAAGLAAEIDACAVPLSDAAREAGMLPLCLTGGDDYELVLAVPPDREAALAEAARAARTPVTRIGRFLAGPASVTVRAEDGSELPLPAGGWSHFG